MAKMLTDFCFFVRKIALDRSPFSNQRGYKATLKAVAADRTQSPFLMQINRISGADVYRNTCMRGEAVGKFPLHPLHPRHTRYVFNAMFIKDFYSFS